MPGPRPPTSPDWPGVAPDGLWTVDPADNLGLRLVVADV